MVDGVYVDVEAADNSGKTAEKLGKESVFTQFRSR